MTELRDVLLGVRHFSPLLQMRETGMSATEMKEMVIDLLEPYFSNQGILEQFALSLLVPEAVNLMRLQADPWALEMYHHCLEVHHSALAVAGDESLRACAQWEPAIQRALSEFWSMFHLEVPKSDLPLEEFRFEAFRNIGALLEACVQPYLRELLHQVRLRDGAAEPEAGLRRVSLGRVVAELVHSSGFPDYFAPPPHSIRLNQWRNIAQHHSSHVEGNEIVCRYGREPNVKEVRLTRNELIAAVWRLFNAFVAVQLGRTIFFVDNVEVAKTFVEDLDVRVEAVVLSFAAAVATQGFEVVDLQLSDEEACAILQDVTDMHPERRRLHASQFVYQLWNHTERTRLKIEYREKDGTPSLLTVAGAEDCERIANGEIEFCELANLTEMTDLKTGKVIPRIRESEGS